MADATMLERVRMRLRGELDRSRHKQLLLDERLYDLQIAVAESIDAIWKMMQAPATAESGPSGHPDLVSAFINPNIRYSLESLHRIDEYKSDLGKGVRYRAALTCQDARRTVVTVDDVEQVIRDHTKFMAPARPWTQAAPVASIADLAATTIPHDQFARMAQHFREMSEMSGGVFGAAYSRPDTAPSAAGSEPSPMASPSSPIESADQAAEIAFDAAARIDAVRKGPGSISLEDQRRLARIRDDLANLGRWAESRAAADARPVKVTVTVEVDRAGDADGDTDGDMDGDEIGAVTVMDARPR